MISSLSGSTAERALWGTALMLALGAALAWRGAVPHPAQPAEALHGAPALLARLADDSLRAAAAAVVASDPFRLARHPSAVAFGAAIEAAPVAARSAPPVRPPLAVSGIVGGGPWQAILEGVPGHASPVVIRPGDVVGELHVRRIGPDTVVIDGADTTWILTVRHPWR